VSGAYGACDVMAHVTDALDRRHAARVSALIAQLTANWGAHCLSEYAFANLWLFRREHDYQFLEGDWPVVRGHTYDGILHAMPLFPLEYAPFTVIDTLLTQHEVLYPVPTAVIQRLDPARYAFSACRDDADYLYPADHFRYYRGTLLNKKRNLMKQLLRKHHVTAVPYGAAWTSMAREVLAGWMHDKGKSRGDADERACHEALIYGPGLGLWGFVYRVDGDPAGFVLAEPLTSGVHVVRFAKSRSAYKGLAQYMFHHLCTEGSVNLAWLNFEQDLGLANFRQTKQSYAPVALLDKWRVRLRLT